MIHLTKYGRRMRLTLISAMSVACFACLFTIPFVEKKLLKNEVGYYSVVIDGATVGAVNSEVEAQQALADARMKFNQDYDNIVYMNPDVSIVEEDRTVATRMSEDELSSAIYSNLFSAVVEMDKQLAYTVRIDDFTVSLASRDEVVELMEKVTSKYDENNEFQVSLDSTDESGKTFGIDVVKSELKNTDIDVVAAALNGDSAKTVEEGTTSSDGITEISFAESVEVNQTQAASVSLLTVDQAYEAITKEKQEKKVYYVEDGDSLSVIAKKHNLSVSDLLSMNSDLNEKSVIIPGDEIIVTVPKSEISVKTVKRKTYEEDYDAEVQYIDDDTAYRGTNTVVTDGKSGRRKVTADITYTNGTQTDIDYVEQNILTEAQPKVVKVGTKTKPTYIKPLSGGSLSSGYGYRGSEFHKGIDWSTPVGTPVLASADGTVTRAGFYSGYGYCVDIKHSDGSMTRYGHNSKVNVSVGQRVTQGQVVAYSGNTGNSSGPHVHFELWINGTTVNPLNYVNKN